MGVSVFRHTQRTIRFDGPEKRVIGKSVRCAVAVLLLTRWITLSQVLRIRISTLTQSGSGGGGGGGEQRGVINFVTRILPNIAATKQQTEL